MIARFNFRCQIPDHINPDNLTVFELVDLIRRYEIVPLADLPWVVVERDELEESRKLAAARAGVR